MTSMMGCHRVMGMLAMSRALGDVMIERYLSQDPDLTEQELSDRDFIVMASDGLWDVISNQEVVHLVALEANKAGWSPDHLTAIANKLCMEAFRRGSMDNITVVIILALSEKEALPHGGGGGAHHHGRAGANAANHRDYEIDSLNDGSLPSVGKHALKRNSTLKGLGGAGGAMGGQGAGNADMSRSRRDAASSSVVGSVGQRLAALAGMRDRGGGDSTLNGSSSAAPPSYGRRGQGLPPSVRQGYGQGGPGPPAASGAAGIDGGGARSSLSQASPLTKRPGGVVAGMGDMWKGRGMQKR